MRLKPSSYLILGMLERGVETGYDIKRAVDASTRLFWSASLAQVYPQLAALEEDGYVVSTDEPRGARPRKVYKLTDKGRDAHGEWLRSEREPHLEFRDEGLLRLFFADGMSGEEAIELVVRLREQAEKFDREFREGILPLAESVGGFPSIVAREE